MHIGNVEINSQLYLAPMAGVTDMAFRQICRELGAGMSCTELVSAKALCYQDKKSRGLLKLAPNERPAAAQIFGSDIPCMAEAAVIAAEELREKYPERTIYVVDTLCASRGEGLLVWYACKKRDEGMTLDELHKWVEDTKLHLCHWFTVDDLMYLKRGGRISAATALVGTMLKVKPVLHVDNEGHLINMFKVRGRKASLEAIANKLGELGGNYDNSTVFICHGDCIEDAKYVENILKTKYGVKEVLINYTGAVIGSHSGPGTMAVFFLGDHR